MLQKVYEVLILFVILSRKLLFGIVPPNIASWAVNLLGLHVFDLLFQSFDDFLAEMASFGELLLYLFVNLNITFQRPDLCGHFIVFKKQLLSLFGLVL